MASQSPPRRWGGIILPVLLIILGLGFLLANLGVLPPGWWRALWRLWPLLLILVGLEILWGRRRWGGLASVVVVLALAGAGLAYFYTQGYLDADLRSADHWELERAGLTAARLEVDFGAGNLYLEALPAAAPQFFEGDFKGLYAPLDKDFQRVEGLGVIKLSSRGRDFVWPEETQEWRLGVSPVLPLELRVKAGAAQVELDLRSLRVGQLLLDLGAARGVVRFPRQAGLTTATIKAGASQLTLEIPSGVAARIRSSLGLASLEVDEGRFPRRGDYYVSPDFDSASHRVEVFIDSGVSAITIR